MPTCYQCFSLTGAASDGIGVCQICNSLACGAHGGCPGGRPAFNCSRCTAGAMVLAAGSGGGGSGGSAPSGPSGGPGVGGGGPGAGSGSGGAAGQPAGGGAGAPGGAGSALPPSPTPRPAGPASSLEFEVTMPRVAEASRDYRAAFDTAQVRDSLRRLFEVRGSTEARSQFLDRIAVDVAEGLVAASREHISGRPNATRYWEERGGEETIVVVEVGRVVGRVGTWLEDELNAWMASIYPVVDEVVWVGARDDVGGVIDVLLVADALGLVAYSWQLDPHRSPFQRLDAVAVVPVPLLVLGHLYAEAVPVRG